MGQIAISINGRPYTIACDDGQEEHLTRLSTYLNERVEELAGSLGQIGDARLLVMAGLLVSDELAEAYADLARLREERDALARRAPPPGADDAEAKALDDLAERLEAIADKLQDT